MLPCLRGQPPAPQRHGSSRNRARVPAVARRPRGAPAAPAAAAAAAASRGGGDGAVPADPPAAPLLPEQQPQHEECWHGDVRRDEYNWATALDPTHPQMLSHLKAENAHTIQHLEHTRQLQLQLQASLNSWLLAEALGSEQHDTEEEEEEAKQQDQQQQQQDQQQHELESMAAAAGQGQSAAVIQADWAGGQGSLRYRQWCSFGWPGVLLRPQQQQQQQDKGPSACCRFFSVPAAAAAAASSGAGTGLKAAAVQEGPAVGSPPMQHFWALAAAAAAHTTSGGLPPGAVLLWSEAGAPELQSLGSSSTSSSKRQRPVRVNTVHSLAVSPDGCYVAVTHRAAPHAQAAATTSSSSSYSLSVVHCSTGRVAMQPMHRVDGPVQWVLGPLPAAAAAAGRSADAASGHTSDQQQQQFLLFVTGDELEVHCCEVPGSTQPACSGTTAAVAPAAATDTLPAPLSQCVFKDPQHVRVSLAAASPAAAPPTAAAAAAAALSFILVHAADGLPRQILSYSSSSGSCGDASASQLPPTDSRAWQELTPGPAAAAAAEQGMGSTHVCPPDSMPPDASLRMVLSVAEHWLLLRQSSAAVPQGELFVAQLPAAPTHHQALAQEQPQQHQQQESEQQQCGPLRWVPVPLPQQPAGLLLEAAMACQQHTPRTAAASASASGLQLLLLRSGCKLAQDSFLSPSPHQQRSRAQDGVDKQHEQQQQQRGGPVRPCTTTATALEGSGGSAVAGLVPCWQHLQAELYQLDLLLLEQRTAASLTAAAAAAGNSHNQCQQQQPEHKAAQAVRLLASCTVPVPDAFFELQAACWSPDSGLLQLTVSSMVRPATQLSIHMHSSSQSMAQQRQQQRPEQQQQVECELRQVQACVPGFEPSDYCTAQLAVPATDGTLLPLSLAWRQQQQQGLSALSALQQAARCGRAGSALQANAAQQPEEQQQQQLLQGTPVPSTLPMLLTCYGSYGIKEAVGFRPELLQLLDAGWLAAVAHVRGGGWLGQAWAEAGRALGKPRSVRDLLDVASYVHQAGLCGRLCLSGSSAGGWLAASAALQQPQLFHALVLTVPCLDLLSLMLQQQQGRIELGDARNDAQVYHTTRSWAPYDLLEQLLAADHQRQQQQQQLGPDACGPSQQPCCSVASASQLHSDISSSSSRSVPRVLIRAGLSDKEVPLHDPVRTTARLRRWVAQQQQQQRWQHERKSPAAAVEPIKATAAAVDAAGSRPAVGLAGDDGSSSSGGGSSMPEGVVLLRVVPGGHTAFEGDVRELALKVAFLLESV